MHRIKINPYIYPVHFYCAKYAQTFIGSFSMAFCPNCDNRIEDSFSVCPHCGLSLNQSSENNTDNSIQAGETETEKIDSPRSRFFTGEYKMVLVNNIMFGTKNDVEVYYCPHCGIIIKDKNSETCHICKKSLKATTEELKLLLEQHNLNSTISILEKENLLDIDILCEIKEKDYKKIGITSFRDRKKLTSLFYTDLKGCLIFMVLFIALIIATILILHHLGLIPSILGTLKIFGISAIIIIIYWWLNF